MKAPSEVFFLRHARVDSHRGDVDVTVEGLAEARQAGRTLARLLGEANTIAFLHAPTRRTAQTATALRGGIAEAKSDRLPARTLTEPEVSEGLRNPDVWIAGRRIEIVSSAEALADQLPGGPGLHELRKHPFMAGFWGRHDRLSYWIEHEDPPGESADEVARRIATFARSLADSAAESQRAFVCVTHSGPMRAIVRRYLLGSDPGEPEWVEAIHLTVHPDGSLQWRFRDIQTDTPTSGRVVW
ncbi:MAG: hypothetical protein NVS4B3_19320 [Gemmatimonadaceae bacterium]